jgi:polyhydroxyalkanoate synthesis regulator phasin
MQKNLHTYLDKLRFEVVTRGEVNNDEAYRDLDDFFNSKYHRGTKNK